MNSIRFFKSLWYPLLPSVSARLHEKRRKGLLYRSCPSEVLECQKEQDRTFWTHFLQPHRAGNFLEVGAGDGIVGSHSLGLEMEHGWGGALAEPRPIPRSNAAKVRNCEVMGEAPKITRPDVFDLLAIHRITGFSPILKALESKQLRPMWVIVENREPDPRWCRWLERSGYRLKFFFHDDEYFKLAL